MLETTRVATAFLLIAVVATEGCLGATDADASIQIAPAVSASFQAQAVTHRLSAFVSRRPSAATDTTPPVVTWTMVTGTPDITVDSTGLVTVSSSAAEGDYVVRASSLGAAATAIIRVADRATGYMVFVAKVGPDDQVFLRDFSKDTAAAQLTSGLGFIGGLAADGVTQTIFFARGSPPSVDIYRIQFDGAALTNLTNDPVSSNQGPAVNLVTHQVFFSRKVGSVQQIVRMSANGTGLVTVTGGTQNKVNPGVSPDGQWLAWGESYMPGFNQEIVTARISGADTVRLTNRTGIDGLSVWLTNSRVLWSQFSNPSDLFVTTAPLGLDPVNVSNSPASESSPGPACTSDTFTYISTAGANVSVVEGNVGSSVVAKFGLGYNPSLVRRVC